jgi:hypothetical protein
VAGTLRYFADRFGVPRAAIEGTTLSYDLIRRYARRGPAEIEIGGPRKHQQLQVRRRLSLRSNWSRGRAARDDSRGSPRHGALADA